MFETLAAPPEKKQDVRTLSEVDLTRSWHHRVRPRPAIQLNGRQPPHLDLVEDETMTIMDTGDRIVEHLKEGNSEAEVQIRRITPCDQLAAQTK